MMQVTHIHRATASLGRSMDDIDQHIEQVLHKPRPHKEKYNDLVRDIVAWRKDNPDGVPLSIGRFKSLRRVVNAKGVTEFDKEHPGIIKALTDILGDRWWVVTVVPVMPENTEEIPGLYAAWLRTHPSHVGRLPLPGETVDGIKIGQWLLDTCMNTARYEQRLPIMKRICDVLGFNEHLFRERVSLSHKKIFPMPDSIDGVRMTFAEWKKNVRHRTYPAFRETIVVDGVERGIGYYLNSLVRRMMLDPQDTVTELLLQSLGSTLEFEDSDWWKYIDAFDLRGPKFYRYGPTTFASKH